MHKSTTISLVIVAMFILSACVSDAPDVHKAGEVTVAHTSFDMLTHGNCLPFNVSTIMVDSVIPLSSTAIEDLCIIDGYRTYAVTSDGELLSCDRNTESVSRIYTLGRGMWGSCASNENGFLLIKGNEGILGSSDDPQPAFCFSSNGQRLWKLSDVGDARPVYYNGKYIFARDSDETGLQLFSMSEGGIRLVQSFDSSYMGVAFLLPSADGLLTLGFGHGPFLITSDSGRYEANLWNENWDQGVFHAVIDPSDRICSLQNDPVGLVVLEKDGAEPLVVPYTDDLSLPTEWVPDPPAPGLVASNGSVVIVRYLNYLLRYDQGAMTIWREDLNKLAGAAVIGTLYIDLTATKTILPIDGYVLLVGKSVEKIPFPGHRSTGLVFSESFEQAVFGTEEGNLVTISFSN